MLILWPVWPDTEREKGVCWPHHWGCINLRGWRKLPAGGRGAYCVKAAAADGIDSEEFGPENPSFNSGA